MKIERFDLIMKYICPKCGDVREDYIYNGEITVDIQGNVEITLFCSCGEENTFELK